MSAPSLLFTNILTTSIDVTIAGASPAAATPLPQKSVCITDVTGAGYGRISSAFKGSIYYIYNQAFSACTILPAVGNFINGADDSSGLSLDVQQGMFIFAVDNTDWYGIKLFGLA